MGLMYFISTLLLSPTIWGGMLMAIGGPALHAFIHVSKLPCDVWAVYPNIDLITYRSSNVDFGTYMCENKSS